MRIREGAKIRLSLTSADEGEKVNSSFGDFSGTSAGQEMANKQTCTSNRVVDHSDSRENANPRRSTRLRKVMPEPQPSHFPSTSPRSKGSALLAAAKTGKGYLDKAVRYVLDSDSAPDKCPEPIWLLGVQHPGYEPPSPVSPPIDPSTRRSSSDVRKLASSPSFRSSPSPPADPSLLLSQSQPAPQKQHPGNHWPTLCYADFTSHIWLTYRSHFQPIRDTSLVSLDSDSGDNAPPPAGSSPILKRWNWAAKRACPAIRAWDACSAPANPCSPTPSFICVLILAWSLDTPSPLAPFSVHRMALAGKENTSASGSVRVPQLVP
jgi:cysteine protease ATG4